MKRLSKQAGQTYDERVGATPCTQTDCPKEALTQRQMGKRLVPYLRTTRANPTGHFRFTKIPAGRYYIVSQIDEGVGTRKEEQQTGLAWLVIVDAGEKLTNLISNRLQSQPVLNLPFSKTSIRIDGV
jgi:hypothetical protein